MNLVTLRNVGVAYEGYEALRHVDLEIAADVFRSWERCPIRARSTLHRNYTAEKNA